MKNTPAPHPTLELLRKSCLLSALLSFGLVGCGAVNTLETPAPKPLVTPVSPAPQPTPAQPETPVKPTPPVENANPNPTPPTLPGPADPAPPVTTPPALPTPVPPAPVSPAPVSPAPQPALNLTPSNITLTAGGSSQVFKATLTNSTNSSEVLSWSLTPNVGALSSSTGSNVTYSPPSSVAAPTTVTLRVTGAGLEQTSQIVLNPAPAPPAPQPTLSLTPINVVLTAGGSVQNFQATLKNSSAALTWSLTPNVGSLSSSTGNNVTYTPPSSVSVQTPVTLKVTGAGLEQTSQIVLNPAPPPPPPPPIIIVTDADKMLAAINAVRAVGRMCGTTSYAAVPALTWNTKLEKAAYLHSKDMAERNYFAHDTPEGVSPWDRMKAQGYSFRAAGENIAAGQMTLEVVIKGWVDSPGHCQNLMSADFTEVGMGRFDSAGSDYKVYWTQDFGKPL